LLLIKNNAAVYLALMTHQALLGWPSVQTAL